MTRLNAFFTILILAIGTICPPAPGMPVSPQRHAFMLAQGEGSKQPSAFVRITTGSGASERDAIMSALRTAIEQVAGAYVTSETLVQMKKVVKDNIQVLSSGSVTSYQLLRSSRQKGLFTVAVAATVATEPVLSFLQEAAGFTIDGDSIYASAKLRQEQTANAHIALCNLMKQFPSFVRLESAAPQIDIQDDEAEIHFHNEDLQQQKAWLRPGWENRLHAVLKAIDGTGSIAMDLFDGDIFHVDVTSSNIIAGYLSEGIRVVPFLVYKTGKQVPLDRASYLPGYAPFGSVRGFLQPDAGQGERRLTEKDQYEKDIPLEFFSTIRTYRVDIEQLKGLKSIIFKPQLHPNAYRLCS